MSSHNRVTQREKVLDENTTLMSTTNLQSFITHANDTFVQVSGYSLQELTGQPHNLVRHPDMPKAAFADMWYTLKQGEPWTGIVKNRCKNGDHYWVRANAVPMVRNGKTTGYMSIRTRATPQEIAAVEPLYQALREGKAKRRIYKGLVLRKHFLGKLPAMPLRWRIRSIMGIAALLWLALSAFAAPGWLITIAPVVLMAFGCLALEWQVSRPIENVARQALKVATGSTTALSI